MLITQRLLFKKKIIKILGIFSTAFETKLRKVYITLNINQKKLKISLYTLNN